jgi:hypothetical protein
MCYFKNLKNSCLSSSSICLNLVSCVCSLLGYTNSCILFILSSCEDGTPPPLPALSYWSCRFQVFVKPKHVFTPTDRASIINCLCFLILCLLKELSSHKGRGSGGVPIDRPCLSTQSTMFFRYTRALNFEKPVTAFRA